MAFEEDELGDEDQSDASHCVGKPNENLLKSDQPVQYLPSGKMPDPGLLEHRLEIQPVQDFTFLSMNVESLKEKQIEKVVDIQSTSKCTESPVLWSIVVNLHQVRAELEVFGVEINTRNTGPWKESELKRLVNLYTSVNKAILNLEDYVKSKSTTKANQTDDICKDVELDVAPKSEPDSGHFMNSPSPADKNNTESATNKKLTSKNINSEANTVKDEMFDADGIKIEVEPVVILNTSPPAFDSDIHEWKSLSKEEILPSVKDNQENGKEINELEENNTNRDESNLVEVSDDLDDCEMEDDDFENEDYQDDSTIEDPRTKNEDLDIKSEDESNNKNAVIIPNKRVSKKFRCLICNVIYSGVKLKDHTLEHHGEPPYQCAQCNESLNSVKDLRDHRWKHYGKEMIECEICHKKMARSSLNPHMKYHTGQGLQDCEICLRKFTPSDLKFHMMSAHQAGEKPFRCEVCGLTFVKGFQLKVHSRVHTGERPHTCKLCGKSYKQSSHLRTHHSSAHEGKKICDICGKAYKHHNDLKNHVASAHEGVELKKRKLKSVKKEGKMCGVCGKVLASVVSMKIHERTHTGEKPYKCDQCDKSFSQQSGLMNHKDTHNNSSMYSCDQCGKSFKHKQALQSHLRNHNEPKTHSCTICSITYTSQSNLIRHERVTHRGVKPYSCDVCQQAFSSTTILRQHMRVHTGEKPFQCDVCNKSFTQNSSLYVHKKKYH